MSVISVPVGGLASAYSSAPVGATLVLAPGEHILGGSSFFTWDKRLTVVAQGYSEATDRGIMVRDGYGNAYTDVPVRLKARLTFRGNATGSVFAGIAFSGTSTTAVSGTILVREANNLTFRDCRFHNRGGPENSPGWIFFTFGSNERNGGHVFDACRFVDCGDPNRPDKDHPLYLKNTENMIVRDCIFHRIMDGWCLHLYSNCDNSDFDRCLFYRPRGGIVFANGNLALPTPHSGCQASAGNTLRRSILFDSVGVNKGAGLRYLVEAYWLNDGCSVVGTGNVVRDCIVRQLSGGGGTIHPHAATYNSPTLDNVRFDLTPQFANPNAGDFRILSGGNGWGPQYLYGTPDPEPMTPVVTEGAVSAAAVFGGDRHLHFANDPDRITPAS